MKLLQVNTTVNSGSTGRIAEDIGRFLMDKGHQSYIAYGRGNRPSKSHTVKIGDKWSVYKHGVTSLICDRHGFASSIETGEFIQKIQEIQPDIIHLHNVHGYYIHIGKLFKFLKEYNSPVVWTLHDSWSYTGHCSYYDSVRCEKWKTLCSKCPKTQAYPKSLILDRSEKNFKDKKRLYSNLSNLHLVTPSQWLADEVSQSFLGDHKVRVINNGVDVNQFKPVASDIKANHSIKDKKVVLGVASIWDKRKGLDDFVQLQKKLPHEYQVVLIGLTKKQINGLPKNIIGIQRTENVLELVHWYSAAHVFVNPTYQDNFPTTNIESLACGTPVISYDTGGSPEAYDFASGETISKGEIDKLVDAVIRWSNQDCVLECRNRAMVKFQLNDRYSDYLELYQSIL